MKKTFLILLFCSISSFLLFAEEGAVAILPDLGNPNAIKVDQERIYITEAARVFIYSKNDFSLMKKFGKSDPNEKFLEVQKPFYKKVSGRRRQKLMMNLNLVFPKYFPAFQKFWVSIGKIYVYTYVEQDKKREIQILDQTGNDQWGASQ